ncbi:deferrochelatase/peroxidase EfeB [Bradyrhizobium diazoefficiens]
MVDLANLQAIVARSSTKPLLAVLLFKFGDAGRARAFLQQWIPRTAAGRAPDPGGPAFHFMFSWKGIEALMAGRPGFDVAQGRREFDVFFVDPAQAPDGGVAEQLGFSGTSAPAAWWDGKFKSGDVDLAIHIGFDTAEQKSDCLADLRQSAASFGVQELTLEGWDDSALSGSLPADGRLHFGYRDGITAPNIDWQDAGTPGTVDCREIVVGYPNEAFPTAPHNPGPWQDFARDGSFVGLSWVYQDVAGFNKFLQDNAPLAAPHVGPELAEEWIAAKLMGRWRHGSPLSRFPDAPPSTPQLDDSFGYGDDPDGVKCPLGAHIRIANCRDQPMKYANHVRFPKGPPRVIRRGFSYGPRLDSVQDDGKDRGIVGLFYFARINEQFYTILRWMQKTEFADAYKKLPNGYNAQDALTGNRRYPKAETQFGVPLKDNASVTFRLEEFIRFKGVAVLFAPSMRALNTMISA